MDVPIDKIKKLLALADKNSGATEAEATQAMEMASALMMKYNVEQSSLVDRPGIILQLVPIDDKEGEKWVGWLAGATSMVIVCKTVIYPGEGIAILGLKHNVEAAAMLFPWLVDQVERLYKRDLPKGMSKSARFDFRRSFKQACSARVYQRAQAIQHRMMTDDAHTVKATGSTALVVRNSVKQQLDAIAEHMQQQGFTLKAKKASKVKIGLGTALGAKAGEEVQLNKTVGGGSRLALTHRRTS